MSTPVSAFAVYNKNKKPQQQPKKKKPKTKKKQLPTSGKAVYNTSVYIPEDKQNNVVQKLKTKISQSNQIKYKSKIQKKKPKLTNGVKKHELRVKSKQPKVYELTPSSSQSDESSDEPPLLVPAQFDDDSCDSEFLEEERVIVQTHSEDEGNKVFKWMIAPCSPADFFKNTWEKKPLHIPRKSPKYYQQALSTPMIDDALRNQNVRYTTDIDITSYVDGKRETHNPDGEPRALASDVWEEYLQGCSIRLKQPQVLFPKIHLIKATMQEIFHSYVGSNIYLTPPESQGFAPHYDDIEAFILQVEGKKRWKIYKPSCENELLPRVSSRNFSPDEIGEPIMELTVEAGDLLYFPRGYIHQAETVDGEHSLHITISMYQHHAWADLFEKMIPAALQSAIENNVEFRQGLPFDIYENFGFMNSDVKGKRKGELTRKFHALFNTIKDYLPLDEGVDEMAKDFQHRALPPVITDVEKEVTVFGGNPRMIEDGKVVNRVEVELDTRVRLLRKNIIRMTREVNEATGEEQNLIFYYVDNSLEYEGRDLQHIVAEDYWLPAIRTLIKSYPNYVAVDALGASNDQENYNVATALWGVGLIMAEKPLDVVFDDLVTDDCN